MAYPLASNAAGVLEENRPYMEMFSAPELASKIGTQAVQLALRVIQIMNIHPVLLSLSSSVVTVGNIGINNLSP